MLPSALLIRLPIDPSMPSVSARCKVELVILKLATSSLCGMVYQVCTQGHHARWEYAAVARWLMVFSGSGIV